jgi:hypothetical protein
MSKIVKPLRIDIQNWSMAVNGGYDHEGWQQWRIKNSERSEFLHNL